MQIRFDRIFLKQVKKLPAAQQKQLAKKITYLAKNPFDARLHTKQLSTPLEGVFSFRITREYRVLFRFVTADEIFLFAAKHRKDIYR